MRTRILLIGIALLSIFIIACPLPQLGKGPTKDVAGGTDQAAPQTGSISVVNDVARNQAVYINESGQRFDVVAEEYPGGPLVVCVQVADFTLVPPSTDPDALPVKALVAGTRDDGSPGVWEIHTDDTIDLPQPADDTSGTRSIIGGDMTTLPDGVQIRNGWGFHVTAVSCDGKMIAGYADNPRGVTIGGVQILPGTTIGVYWRVYSLFGNRFCIISPPRIIGSFVKQPLPDKWAAHWRGRSALLEQLRLYFVGTLQSYLTTATSFVPPQAMTAADRSAGLYEVNGINEDGLPALAKIDKTGNVTITVFVPDLAVSGVTVSTSSAVGVSTASTADQWSVSAAVANEGTAQAAPVKVQYWLSPNAVFDPTAVTTVLLDTVNIHDIQPGSSVTVTTSKTFSLDGFKLPAGTWYVAVTASTDPKLGEIDTTDNEAQAQVAFQGDTTSTPPTTYNDVFIETYDPSGAGLDAVNNTKITLYDANGKELASCDGFATSRSYSVGYAWIDYKEGAITDFVPLVSGDYFLKIEGTTASDSFGYGVRVLDAESRLYEGWDVVLPAATNDPPLVGPGSVQATADQTIILDVPPSSPAPNAKLGRWVAAFGANWVKIHLP